MFTVNSKVGGYEVCLHDDTVADQTVKQIDEYLSDKQLNKAQRDSIIDKLKNYGLLDDEKYAVHRIEVLDNALNSKRQIRQKLKQEGISEQLIIKYLEEDDDNEYEKALSLAKKYEASIRNKTAKMKRQTLMNKLSGQGYPYEIAAKAVDALRFQEENELELLNREYEKALNKYAKKYEGYDLKNHITSYLLSKGFTYDEIRKVSEEYNG